MSIYECDINNFIPDDVPTQDEIESIERSKKEIIYYKVEDIDWDNLDKMDLS